MTENELREIEVRANAATPGPWIENGLEVEGADGNCEVACYGYDDETERVYGVPRDEDRAFIIAARTDIPRLLVEIRRLRALFTEEDAQLVDTFQDFLVAHADHKQDERIARRAILAASLAARIRQVRPTDTGEKP